MYSCYKDYFKAEGNSYIKHIIHFNCKCKEDHEIFVHFCSQHNFRNKIPTIADYAGTIRDRCYCARVHANEICQFCCQAMYTLNFTCHKNCVEDSKYFRDFLIKLKQFLWMIILKKYLVSLIFILRTIRLLLALITQSILFLLRLIKDLFFIDLTKK